MGSSPARPCRHRRLDAPPNFQVRRAPPLIHRQPIEAHAGGVGMGPASPSVTARLRIFSFHSAERSGIGGSMEETVQQTDQRAKAVARQAASAAPNYRE